jgi:hypothetical protein
MLAGSSERVREQLQETDFLDLIGEENVFLGQPEFGASLREAVAAAEEWMKQNEARNRRPNGSGPST